VAQAESLPSILIGMQIATLGWRINREIPLGDQGRRTWFPVADYLNVLSMLLVVWFCIVLPLNEKPMAEMARIVLSVGFILMVMYPINLIGHYRFASRMGRSVYTKKGRDFPWITDHEWITLALTALFVGTYLVSECPALGSSLKPWTSYIGL
jgi:hypothetical protein